MPALRSMFRALALTGAIVLAGGCTTTGGHDSAAAVPAGSTVTVNEPIDLAVGDARVFIQGGRPTPWDDLAHFHTYCGFRLRKTPGDAELQRTIRPGTFTTGEPRGVGHVRLQRARPVRVAALRLGMGIQGGGASVGRVTYAVVIPLHSPEQPQVRELACAFDRDPSGIGPEYPDLEAMRTALGGLASIRPAAGN